MDKHERKIFAYTDDVSGNLLFNMVLSVESWLFTSQRLFTFDVPVGVEVIECNIVSLQLYLAPIVVCSYIT